MNRDYSWTVASGVATKVWPAKVRQEARMAKVTVSFPDDFLKQVDREAKARHRSRSEFIREVLRDAMKRPRASSRSWKKALRDLRRLEHAWVGDWDSTDLIRSDRDRQTGRQHRR
jgi:Arc/MetJ-type ribon-helix-helix transcriptional regulator